MRGIDIFGLVLAGGMSSRMGTDKSLLVYHEKPQREHVFDLLSGCCRAVFTSCRRKQVVPANLHPIADRHNVPGPLNGILSGFAEHPHVCWLVMAVDMPNVDADALNALVAARDPYCLATAYANPADGLPEPMLSLWEPHAFPALRKFARTGRASPREFLKKHPVRLINPPGAEMLANVNSPESAACWPEKSFLARCSKLSVSYFWK